MSKKIKLLVTVTAVVILACAMAATAFAVSQTGKVNTNGYIGNYSANLQTTKERTDASLKVDIRIGPGYVSTAASTVSCVVKSGTSEIGHFFNAGSTECEGYCTYGSGEGYTNVTATCEYHFYNDLLCTLTEEVK